MPMLYTPPYRDPVLQDEDSEILVINCVYFFKNTLYVYLTIPALDPDMTETMSKASSTVILTICFANNTVVVKFNTRHCRRTSEAYQIRKKWERKHLLYKDE